jgi:HK97 gp10 family phage protein
LSIRITVTGVDEAAEHMAEAAHQLSSAVHTRLEYVCQEIADYARSIAPKRTGHYSETIYYMAQGECKFVIGASAAYAAIIEFGSMPHFILPRNAKVLRFEVDGETVFAKWVHHPGTMPQLIMHRAKKDNYEKIIQAVRDGVREALKGG